MKKHSSKISTHDEDASDWHRWLLCAVPERNRSGLNGAELAEGPGGGDTFDLAILQDGERNFYVVGYSVNLGLEVTAHASSKRASNQENFVASPKNCQFLFAQLLLIDDLSLASPSNNNNFDNF